MADVADRADELLTAKQVGAIVGRDPTTIWRWANRGLLPFVPGPTSRHWRRYRRSDVERLAGITGRGER